MTDKPLALVTGATGAVGPRVVAALYDAGYLVRTLSMDAPPDGGWPEGVEAVIGDITDQAALDSAMRGVDAVVHLAALLHIVSPPPELREKYERINVGGTANVVEAARQAGVGRLVFFSTIAVYGPSAGVILTEDSPTHPDSFYAQTKLDAEKIVLAAKREDGKPLGVVLRLGAVYGARIKGNYQRLLHALARSRFLPIGRGDNRRTLVHDRDVARAALSALEHPAAAGKIFNVSDGRFHTMNEIIGTICNALGRRPPWFSLPVGPTRGLVGLVEKASRGIVGTRSRILANSGHVPTIPGQALSPTIPLVTRAMIDKYTEDVAVDSRRIQNELGFVPRYDLAAGWKETVDEMRRNGEI